MFWYLVLNEEAKRCLLRSQNPDLIGIITQESKTFVVVKKLGRTAALRLEALTTQQVLQVVERIAWGDREAIELYVNGKGVLR